MMAEPRSTNRVIHPEILLVEQSAMIGSIIVSTVRQLGLQSVRLASNSRSALLFMENKSFSGVITSLDDEEDALMLIQHLREGKFRSAADTPVAITTAQCSTQLANRIKVFNVRRILLKPFKIRDLVSTIEILASPEVA